MRIKIDNVWVAGHPDYEPGIWTPAQGPLWLPTRGGDWQSGAGFERVQFEDVGNPAFSLKFDVQRTFSTQRLAADWITAMHSRTPPHPWHGEAVIRFDREDGGTVDIEAGACVLQLVGPITSLGGTGRLTLQAGYVLHGGVLGDQPVLTDPEDPTPYEYTDPPIPYES